MPTSCAVSLCRSLCESNSSRHGLTFHKFPNKDTEYTRYKIWVEYVNRPNWTPSKHSRLCSLHFEDEYLDRTGQTTRMKIGAIPTVFNLGQSLLDAAANVPAGLAGDMNFDINQLQLPLNVPSQFGLPQMKPSRRACDRKYTTEDLDMAMEAIRQGMSKHEASRKWQIPRSTLIHNLQGKYTPGKHSPGPASYIDNHHEGVIKEYILYTEHNNRSLKINLIAEMIKELLDYNLVKSKFTDNMPSAWWVRKFFQRHSELSTQVLSTTRFEITNESLLKWYKDNNRKPPPPPVHPKPFLPPPVSRSQYISQAQSQSQGHSRQTRKSQPAKTTKRTKKAKPDPVKMFATKFFKHSIFDTVGAQINAPLQLIDSDNGPLQFLESKNPTVEFEEYKNKPVDFTDDKSEPQQSINTENEPLPVIDDRNEPLQFEESKNEPIQFIENKNEPLNFFESKNICEISSENENTDEHNDDDEIKQEAMFIHCQNLLEQGLHSHNELSTSSGDENGESSTIKQENDYLNDSANEMVINGPLYLMDEELIKKEKEIKIETTPDLLNYDH